MIDRAALKEFVVQTAGGRFGDRAFKREELIHAVEEGLRSRGDWMAADNRPLQGGSGTAGSAAIERAISDLRREDRLKNPGPGLWRVPARFWPSLASRAPGANGATANGALPDEDTIRERLRRLESVTGQVGGPPIPDSALDRGALYD